VFGDIVIEDVLGVSHDVFGRIHQRFVTLLLSGFLSRTAPRFPLPALADLEIALQKKIHILLFK
jgi:hypothetical protein